MNDIENKNISQTQILSYIIIIIFSIIIILSMIVCVAFNFLYDLTIVDIEIPIDKVKVDIIYLLEFLYQR